MFDIQYKETQTYKIKYYDCLYNVSSHENRADDEDDLIWISF